MLKAAVSSGSAVRIRCCYPSAASLACNPVDSKATVAHVAVFRRLPHECCLRCVFYVVWCGVHCPALVLCCTVLCCVVSTRSFLP